MHVQSNGGWLGGWLGGRMGGWVDGWLAGRTPLLPAGCRSSVVANVFGFACPQVKV